MYGFTCTPNRAVHRQQHVHHQRYTNGETSNTTYTVTANISNVTYQGSVWLSASPYGTITSAVEGAHLNLGEAMTPITLNYTVNANGGGSSSSSSFVYANDKLSNGERHTCAILDNGDLKCWGSDQYGQVGDGGPTWTLLPHGH